MMMYWLKRSGQVLKWAGLLEASSKVSFCIHHWFVRTCYWAYWRCQARFGMNSRRAWSSNNHFNALRESQATPVTVLICRGKTILRIAIRWPDDGNSLRAMCLHSFRCASHQLCLVEIFIASLFSATRFGSGSAPVSQGDTTMLSLGSLVTRTNVENLFR